MTRRQCEKCPWKVTTNPHEIPMGYSEEKHRRLVNTVAEPGSIEKILSRADLRIMACHESPIGEEVPCVGWLVNQLNEGNNIQLRLAVSLGKFNADVQTVGEQHPNLEATFPKERP